MPRKKISDGSVVRNLVMGFAYLDARLFAFNDL